MMAHLHKTNMQRQRGVSLVVVLILLLIMTLLGLASMRGSILQERMGSGLYDRSLSFQAAEAAVREAEARLEATPAPVFPSSGCAAGLCAEPVAGTANRWDLASPPAGTWANATTDVTLAGKTATPAYMIERMGDTPRDLASIGVISDDPTAVVKVYRITARSTQTDRATVILQSNFTTP
jgi:type IV pilus assembly protein PilX